MLNITNINSALEETAQNGAAIIRRAVQHHRLYDLISEVRQQKLTSAPRNLDKVTQSFKRIAFRYQAVNMPYVALLQYHTQRLIRKAGPIFPILENWQANDIVIQRYKYNDFITGHKDYLQHQYVIAIYTIFGSCEFDILSSREGPVAKHLHPQAGDLVLLRAPKLTEGAKRPFHQVSGNTAATDSRISITFRSNTNPEKIEPSFGYAN